MNYPAILDTSWLDELYQIPGKFDKSRTSRVRTETTRLIQSGSELYITTPVLFEVATHITYVTDGNQRRRLAKKLSDDIDSSFKTGSPWTITPLVSDPKSRRWDVLILADRFQKSTGPNYTLADISVILLIEELQKANIASARILTFDEQLNSHSY